MIAMVCIIWYVYGTHVTHLVRNGWYTSGTFKFMVCIWYTLVRIWYALFCYTWYAFGTHLIRIWYASGTHVVCIILLRMICSCQWYAFDTHLVRTWYA
jgi:hypothetical protein